MSQTDSHDPSQGELSGEVTNRLLMDMPQSPRRAGNRLLKVLGALVFVIAVSGISIGLFLLLRGQKEEGVEYPDLSYHEFVKEVSKDEIDPEGASNIYYKRMKAPEGEEGYDVWMRMKIEQHSYDMLRNDQRRKMEDMRGPNTEYRFDPVSKIVVPNWGEFPIWWENIKSVKSTAARCATWNVESRGRSHSLFMAYDPDEKTLWIWKREAPSGQSRGGSEKSTPEPAGESKPAGETGDETSNPGTTDAPAGDDSAGTETPTPTE